MVNPTKIVLAFDAYGTLLSTESISKQLAAHFGEAKAAILSQEWRKYQLEYTWRLNSMGKYIPFNTVTRQALLHTLAEADLSLSVEAVDALIQFYNTLSLFPDVHPLFSHLSSSSSSPPPSPQTHAVIFTNGTTPMLTATLSQSPEIAPHAYLFRDVVTVDAIRKFKPCPEVYQHLVDRVEGLYDGERRNVWLVSGNPFDVVGAKAAGLSACWVDRSGKGWVDRLGDEVFGFGGRPDVVVRGVDEVVGKVGEAVGRGELGSEV